MNNKQFTTVTPFSKFIALLMFILFPVAAFYLGMKLQASIDGLEGTSITIHRTESKMLQNANTSVVLPATQKVNKTK